MIEIKSKEEIDLMEKACSIVSKTLCHLEQYIQPGVETIELDNIAEEYIRGKNAIPGFKGLYGFPATLCISVEDEVVHGIPKNKVLYTIGKFGNTSSASIPLSITDKLQGKIDKKNLKIVMTGFGVGYSFGAVASSFGPIFLPKLLKI